VGKPERIRPILSLRCRWEDNIERNFKEIGREVVTIWRSGWHVRKG
jgi:hypothetical protein